MASSATPSTVNGGCLCGSIRFTASFPPGYDFVGNNSSCQCEQCRKNSGALVWHAHKIKESALTFHSKSTLSNFNVTPEANRGFCQQCGSFLYWQRSGSDVLSFSVGTFDKEDLQKYGQVFATGGNHLWYADAIAGATDHLDGARWHHDNEGEGAKKLSST